MGQLRVLPIKTRCWNCGAEHGYTASILQSNNKPNDGDLSFCFMCGSLALFDSSLTDGVRKPSPRENDALNANKSVQKLKMLWLIHNTEAKED